MHQHTHFLKVTPMTKQTLNEEQKQLLKDFYEERAAIYQFEAGFTKHQAEIIAYNDAMHKMDDLQKQLDKK